MQFSQIKCRHIRFRTDDASVLFGYPENIFEYRNLQAKHYVKIQKIFVLSVSCSEKSNLLFNQKITKKVAFP